MAQTRRLYHEDPEQKTFEASVISTVGGPEGSFDVVLDRTAFYPTGGGQPHDRGRLGGQPVLDVIEDGRSGRRSPLAATLAGRWREADRGQ